MESLQILTDKYLRSMSPLAQRIGEDVDMAREAYQELWDTLNHEEQQQVLNEALIDPAAVLKYAKYTRNASDWNESAAAAAAAQFSWFTKSQLNLFSDPNLRNKKRKSLIKKTESFSPIAAKNLVVENIVIDSGSSKARPQSSSSSSESNNLLNKLKNKVTNLKIPSSSEEKQSLVENKIQISVVSKGPISKPKTPPPPPPVKHGSFTEKKALLSTDNESDLGDDIPKTGFDFLDNW